MLPGARLGSAESSPNRRQRPDARKERDGISYLKRGNGDWFRERLLSRGGSADPMVLLRSFRGREPRIEPLLECHGLQTESKQ